MLPKTVMLNETPILMEPKAVMLSGTPALIVCKSVMLPYFFGYKMEFFPSKTIQKI